MQLQVVRASKRSKGYIRRAAENIADPSPLQAAQRLRLSQASMNAFATKGVVNTPDGRKIPLNASVIAPLLKGHPNTSTAFINTPTHPQDSHPAAPVLLENDQVMEPLVTLPNPIIEPDKLNSAETPINAREEIARVANVSGCTVAKVGKIEEKATLEQFEVPAASVNDSAFVGTLLMIGADIFDAAMDQKIIPLIMTPASAKILSCPKRILQGGKQMTTTQNPLMAATLSAMSDHLQLLRLENVQLKTQFATRAAAPRPEAVAIVQPAQPVHVRKPVLTQAGMEKKYGFMG